jgi:hypothetical protein
MKTPKEEAEDLMNSALPFAERMLAEHGEFLPYGEAMDRTGKFIAISASDGRAFPPSKDLIKTLKDGFREAARAGKYKATALVYDVRIALPSTGTKSDAIAVSLNHEERYSALVLFAYQIDGNKVVMGKVFAQQEDNYTFPDTQ